MGFDSIKKRTAEDTAEFFRILKENRYKMYIQNINQFKNVINNEDCDGIREFYGNEPNSYFERVLELLNEPIDRGGVWLVWFLILFIVLFGTKQ